jgi:glycosyltransferase involved in cell wall biosynthesis
MKIAVVTQNFPVRENPYQGHSVYQTVLRMSRLADVRVYSPQPHYVLPFQPRSRGWRRTDPTYSPAGVHTSYVNYPAIAGVTRPINGYVCAYYLEPILRRDRPDVILNYWIYPDGFAAVQLGRRFRIPVLVKAIGSDLNQPLDFISRRLTLRTLREADMVLTVSQHLRRTVIGMDVPTERVRAVPNGCDISVFHRGERDLARRELGIEESVSLVLYVGRLDLAKGLDELVRATAQIASQGPMLQVVLVGDGPARAQLEFLAMELGIAEFVRFVGPCPSSEVARWMRAANVFALPSYREGCPNVVLEALSCGLPVVATDVGGIPELVDEKCGILIHPQDPVALANALSIALNRFWDRDQISKKMQRGWDLVAEETVDACRSALGVATRDTCVKLLAG